MPDRKLPPVLVVGEIGLVRSLGEAGIPLHVGSYYNFNVGLYSRYCSKRIRFSHTSSDRFADELVEYGKSQKQKTVFFSDDDRAVLTFSRNRSRLSEYFYFNLPDHSTVEDMLDKRRFALVTRRLDIPAPKTFVPETLPDLLAAANELSYPCVLKPAKKDEWWHPEFLRIVGPYRKAIQCESKNELIEYYKKVVQIHKDVIVQEYVAGNDSELFSVNMYLDKQQKLLAYFIGHKLRIYPIHAGVATLVETVDDNNMLTLAVGIARKLNITGHLNIQFKRDSGKDTLNVIEIHTRNSLWCYLSTGAGLNISAIAYYDMIGMPCPLKNNYQAGVKWLDISKDVKALRSYRAIGELTYRAWLRSLRGTRVHHVISWKDPLPGVMDAWFITKRRFEQNMLDGAAPQA